MIKRFWMGLMTVLLAIAVTITINYAWFVKSYDVNPLADGSSTDAYYYTGSGTDQDPYVITTPRHLYNLAWLQYLGRYNKDAKSGTTFPATYFRLGMEADGTLDMSGWPLPPIGTTKYPFIGNFNGNGWTITGLTTTNTWSEFGSKHPSTVNQSNFEKANCSVIGFFGSIGAFNGTVISDQDTNVNNAYSYDTTNNKVYNFYLNDNNVHTTYSTTLIGAVAGYVNAELSQIGVIQPNLNIQATGATPITTKTSSNLSDFAVVGYAEANYKTQKTKNSTIIYNPTYNYSHFNFKGMGNQADWGGSMNMAELYSRIVSKIPYTAQSYTYVNAELRYENVPGKTTLTTTTNTANQRVSWSGNENGGYIKRIGASGQDSFNYLTAVYKDVIKIRKTNNTESGYIIFDKKENYYLDISSTRSSTTSLDFNVSLASGSGDENQRVWVYSGNRIYTYNADDGQKYYLNATTTSLSVSTTASTSWTLDSTNNAFYFTNGINYYLKYYNGNWCVTPLYKISDGNGHYLTMNSTTDNKPVTNASASDATVWEFSTNGANPLGTIKTISGGTTRYLRLYNGNLVTSSSTTNWSNSGSGLYNGSNYIQFRNGYWVAMTNPAYKIGYSTNYLSTSATNTNSNDAALWTFGDNLATSGGSGTASMVLNGTTQYLTNNNGNLTVSTTATTWYNDGGNLLYSTANNQKYYLIYDNGWKLDVMDYYIKDSGSNYLAFNDSTSIKNATSATTLWHFSNASTYPQGAISCTDGNSTYYLEPNGTSVILSNASTTTWVNDGDGLYYTNGVVKYYLVYDNGWKLVSYTFKISYNGNYLILNGSTLSNSTNQGTATEWTFSNGGTNPSGTISSNGYYLYLDANGVLTTTTTAGNATVFSNAGSGLYDSYNNYIQFYNNKWVCGKAIRIQYDGHYLNTTDGNTVSNSNTENSSSIWFSYGQNTELVSGPIYTVNNGSIKYLNPSTSYAMTLNTTNSIWYFTEDGITQDNNSNDSSYIQYLNGNWYLTNGFTISYNNRYLNINGTQINTNSSTTPNCFWYFDNSDRVYTVINGTNYYLKTTTGSNSPTLSIGTGTGNNPLIYDDGKLYISNSEPYVMSSRTYYYWLNLNNTTWRITRNRTNSAPTLNYYYFPGEYLSNTSLLSLNLTTSTTTNRNTYVNEVYNNLSFTSVSNVSTLVQTYEVKLSGGTTNIYTRSNTSQEPSRFNYIPLNVDDNHNVLNTNTGYILAGGYENNYNQTGRAYYHADIRVSQYGLTDIGSSYSSSSSDWTSKGILTVGANGYSTTKQIGSADYPESQFTKYTSSKAQLLQTLKSSSNVFGLHFMESAIDINHLATAPKAKINGVTYTNYQMPEDCIDFQLASRGYINFFAGTYFSNNNSFFSLHQIIRDETDANGDGKPDNPVITAIKHISKIYKANSTYGSGYQAADFIYQYTDGSWSVGNSTPGSTYSLAFDKSWIETPQNVSGADGSLSSDTYKNYLWYFEIPVNKGEYALGSVDGGTGAYLIYLDIGANAAPVDRTEIRQQTVYTQETMVYAKGIQVLASGSTFTSDSNSAVAKITVGNVTAAAGNDITISRGINQTTSLDTITFSPSLASTYYDPGIALSNGTLSPIASSSRVSNVLKYIDYNRTTDYLYYTTIYNDGTSNTSYDCYQIDKTNGAVIQQITDTSSNADWGILVINNGSGTPTDFEDFDNIAENPYTYGSTKILDYYSVILTSDLTDYSDTNTMRVVADTTVQAPNDGEYVFEHSYSITGNDITMSPDELLVYIGPELKASATITGPTSNVVTVTTEVNNVTYTFTFNASAMNPTAKTVTIDYVAPE